MELRLQECYDEIRTIPLVMVKGDGNGLKFMNSLILQYAVYARDGDTNAV